MQCHACDAKGRTFGRVSLGRLGSRFSLLFYSYIPIVITYYFFHSLLLFLIMLKEKNAISYMIYKVSTII